MELDGNDVRTAVGVFASQALWMLGYPDQAAQVSDQKDADARRLGHPFDIGWALTWGAYVFDYRCEPERLLARADEADRLAREQSIPVLYDVLVPVGQGLARLRMGQLAEAISLLRQGIDGWNGAGGHLNVPYMKSALAEALARQGDLDAGLALDRRVPRADRAARMARAGLARPKSCGSRAGCSCARASLRRPRRSFARRSSGRAGSRRNPGSCAARPPSRSC